MTMGRIRRWFRGTFRPERVETESLRTERATISEGVTATGQSGNVHPSDKVTFSAVKSDSIGFAGQDPELFSYELFDDGEYRMLNSPSNVILRKTPNFSEGSFTTVDDNYLSEFSFTSVQDHVVTSDGTILIFLDENGDSAVLGGDDLQSMSRLGVISSYPDVGAIIEDGTIHMYTEGAQGPNGSSSNVLRYYTAPEDDPTNATYQKDVIDVSAKNWRTGDPDLIKVGSRYYIFTDRHYDGDASVYRIAVASAADPSGPWSIDSQNMTGVRGGDMVLTQAKDGVTYHALTEFSGTPNDTVYWRVFVTPTVGNIQGHGNFLPVNLDAGDGTAEQVGMFETAPAAGQNNFYTRMLGTGADQGNWLLDPKENKIGGLVTSGNDIKVQALTGKAKIEKPGNSVEVANDNTVFYRDGSRFARFHNDGGLEQEPQDLSVVSGNDGRIYHHDGSASITADGGTSTSAAGYYAWSSTDDEWKSMVQY
jgi:hypothetical protein